MNAGSAGNALTFSFTASENMDGGEVALTVPPGWTVPHGTPGSPGYVTATSSTGTSGTAMDALDGIGGWAAGSACAGGLTSDAVVLQEGSGSLRCVNGNQASGNRWYKNVAAQDWSGFTKVAFWLRSDLGMGAASHLQFAYDNDADLASPLEVVDLGQTIAADTWTYVVITFGATARASVASFGFIVNQESALDNNTVWIDDMLIGPGLPTFPGDGEIRLRLLELSGGKTVSFTYGVGGGANGAAAPASGESSVFVSASRSTATGTLTAMAFPPTVSVTNPVPSTSGISPTSRATGSGEFTLTVTGANFVPASVVRFDGVNRTTTYVSPTQLTTSVYADETMVATFNVTVFNPAPGGGTSNGQPFSMTADASAPAAVTNLALSGATTQTVNLAWTAPGDDGAVGTATLYDIRWATSPIVTSGDFAVAALVSGEPAPAAAGTAQTMTVTGLSANTLYYFAMKTQDEGLNVSAVSNMPSISTAAAGDTAAPAAITDLTPSSPTASSIVLAWTAPGDDPPAGSLQIGAASLYDIRWSTSPIITLADFTAAALVSGEPVPLAAGTVQSMTVTGLAASTLHYFAMKASDEVPNVSAISNVPALSTNVSADTVAPAAVTNLALSGATTQTVNLAWTAPGDDGAVGTASLYDIRWSTSPIVTLADFTAAALVAGEPAPAAAGTAQTMTVTGLSANTLHFFAMKTQDEGPNVSAVSNLPSISTAASADVSAPAAVTSLALSAATSSSITLTWTAPGDDAPAGANPLGTATLYDIRRSTSPIVTLADFTAATLVVGEPAPLPAGTVQAMTVTGLAAATTYFFAMKTSDEAPNVSAVSNVPALSTMAASGGGGGGGGGGSGSDSTPPSLFAASAASITQRSVIITWQTSESADSLVRFGLTSALGGTALNAVQTISHAVSITALTPGTTYHYTLCSSDFVGNQACLGEFVFTTLPDNAPVPAYSAAEALAASPTINADKTLAPFTGATAPCVSGTRIKLPSDGNAATQVDSAVYYCGADGKRYGFPDAGTYHSWYPDFSGIIIVSPAELAAVPLGGNVTYRPGSRMVKVQTDPKVYAIARGGTLRWVTSEAVATALYGVLWNRLISDVSDAFFVNYVVGMPITPDDVVPAVPATPL